MSIEGASRQAPEEGKTMFAFWIAVVGMAVAIVVPAPDMEGARGGRSRDEARGGVHGGVHGGGKVPGLRAAVVRSGASGGVRYSAADTLAARWRAGTVGDRQAIMTAGGENATYFPEGRRRPGRPVGRRSGVGAVRWCRSGHVRPAERRTGGCAVEGAVSVSWSGPSGGHCQAGVRLDGANGPIRGSATGAG